MAIRLYENFRALLYTPFLAAHALDAYKAEGVDVQLMDSPEPGFGAKQVLAGGGDATWGGPMRVLQLREQQPGLDLVCFCEAICRDPFSLVGAKPRPGFTLPDLKGLRFASVSEVPTPWMCLQDDIRRAGVDPASLNRVTDKSMADHVAALKAGTIDVAQLFEPYVTQALQQGGHLWHSSASRGLTAYTSFYTTRASLDQHRDEYGRMVRAMFRTLKWVHARPPAEIAATVQKFFPQIERPVLVDAIGRYKTLGIWNHEPVLLQEGFDRLKGALVTGGLIKKGDDYARCVDTSFAVAAVAANPPSM
jgi:NitT/TauT family transport system substrate-binding protein